MKRKNNDENGDGAETIEQHLKRTRSGNRRQRNMEVDGILDELDTTPIKSTRGIHYVHNMVGCAPSQKFPGSDDIGDHELAQGATEAEIGSPAGSVSTNLVKRRPGRPKKNINKTNSNGTTHRKKFPDKQPFATPVKSNGLSIEPSTPKLERNADRSARRKSTRRIIEQSVLGITSDNDYEEDEIVQHIYESGEEDDIALDEGEAVEDIAAPADDITTPSKRGRGRPKGSKNRQRSPTPIQDLLPHELYFSQNRNGRSKTSNSNLSSLALLDHEEYFSLSRKLSDPHADDVRFLQDLHTSSFNQWQFELSQGFNICVYGWGSKKSLLMKFAEHISKTQAAHLNNKTIIVNGYVHNLTIRDVLHTIAASISDHGQKLGSQPADMFENLMALLEDDRTQDITLIIHSIDQFPLRRTTTQSILSRLGSHPQIHLVVSADHPSFPLLWDSSLRSTYNYLFHDCTTFEPYAAEVDVVDVVHELLGRSGRRVGGKEGVSFVLKSLPENAKNLFRILIGEQLASMDDSDVIGFGGADDDENEQRIGSYRKSEPGVEYRVLYQKAVEEFICSNEMNFRTLLKEFHDHQMIQSRKDALGTEMLSVPFRKEELETILEDIMS